MGGNGATGYFLTFALLAAVLGILSKIAGGKHLRSWRNDSLAAAGSSSLIAWAVTALAFGGWRGWRLRIVEAFVIILAFTQLLYVAVLHAGFFSSAYGPGYRDPDYGLGAPGAHEPVPKGGVTAGATI
ncbi:hypothetical protein DH2020_035738 [Rehmannia glutinosa]|uniref:Uncharacterized protein n=1 Tax=Rehmannia glutinosa TaxID=99300 RepID=A0ABR0V8W1_REHGL